MIRAGAGGPVVACLLLRLDGFQVERDLHLVADDDAAGLERGVPRETPVFPVDAGGGSSTDACEAPWILHFRSRAIHLQHDCAGHAAYRQIALDLESIFGLAEFRAAEVE